MEDFILFLKWALSISGGTIFLLIVSIYLHRDTRHKRGDTERGKRKVSHLVKDFVFVWVLIGLLVFYIVSVELGSALIFAVGNIVVEGLLIAYAIQNREESDSTS